VFDLLLAINILIKVRQVEMAHHTCRCRDVKGRQVCNECSQVTREQPEEINAPLICRSIMIALVILPLS